MPIYSPNVTPAVTAAILRRRQISGFILSAISFFMILSITYTIMYRKHIIALSSIPIFKQKNTRHMAGLCSGSPPLLPRIITFLPIIPFPLLYGIGIMLALAARVFIAIDVYVLAYLAGPARFKVILHICPPPSVRNTTHSASMPSAPRRVLVAACVWPYIATGRARF